MGPPWVGGFSIRDRSFQIDVFLFIVLFWSCLLLLCRVASSNAGLQYITIGDMAEGQKLLQQSRGDMDVALSLNGAATGMYDKSTQIGGQPLDRSIQLSCIVVISQFVVSLDLCC